MLDGIITNLTKDFMKGMDLINAKATTEVEDAYLVKQMLPVYAEVRKIKGIAAFSKDTWLNHKLMSVQVERTSSYHDQRSATLESDTLYLRTVSPPLEGFGSTHALQWRQT